MNATLSADFTARGGMIADIPAAVKLFNNYSEHHLGFRGFTENMIETEWKTPKFNVEEDIRLVLNSLGDLVGYIEVWTISDLPAHPWVWGRVHPDYHRQSHGKNFRNPH